MRLDTLTNEVAEVIDLLDPGLIPEFFRAWDKLPRPEKTAVAEFILLCAELGIASQQKIIEPMQAYLADHAPDSIHLTGSSLD
jgi:hypothetical protein